MSMQGPSSGSQLPGQNASATDVVTQLQGIVRQLSLWVLAFTGRVTTGTFTLAAAATTTVPQPAVKTNSNIDLTATNASAGTLQGSVKSLYISALVPGASFTVATASGGAAAGTETFSYKITTTS